MIRKPEFLKTKREKRRENQEAVFSLAGTIVELALAIEDRNDRKTREELENENTRLRNELMRKQLVEDGTD